MVNRARLRQCSNENCTAVNRWKLGEVSVVNQFQINKEKRRGEEVKDVPIQYAVPVICASYGRDYYHYEEPERTLRCDACTILLPFLQLWNVLLGLSRR